jgi:hypothetical protein
MAVGGPYGEGRPLWRWAGHLAVVVPVAVVEPMADAGLWRWLCPWRMLALWRRAGPAADAGPMAMVVPVAVGGLLLGWLGGGGVAGAGPRRGGRLQRNAAEGDASPYAYTYEFSGKSDAENMNFPSTFSGFPGILH